MNLYKKCEVHTIKIFFFFTSKSVIFISSLAFIMWKKKILSHLTFDQQEIVVSKRLLFSNMEHWARA